MAPGGLIQSLKDPIRPRDSNFVGCHRHREWHAQDAEVLQATSHFIGLRGAEFEEIARSLSFTDEVQRLVVMLEDRPVGVVRADGCVDLEPLGQLQKELDVIPLVQALGKVAFNLRFADDVVID